jgi:hypothetical protein
VVLWRRLSYVRSEYRKKEDRSGDGQSLTFGTFLDNYNMDNIADPGIVELDGPWEALDESFSPRGADGSATDKDEAFARAESRYKFEERPRNEKLTGKGGIYHIHEVDKRLLGDIWLPRGYLPFMKGLTRAPIMWMSSGMTSSVLHNDGDDNINCVLAGRKLIVLINATEEEEVYNSDAWSGYGTRSPIDPVVVDLDAWPRIANTHWWHVELAPGDCVYMPMAWFHAVRSPRGRSIAVNVWFNPMLEPDWEGYGLSKSVGTDPPAMPIPPEGEAGAMAPWESALRDDESLSRSSPSEIAARAAGLDDTWQPEKLSDSPLSLSVARSWSDDFSREPSNWLDRISLLEPVWEWNSGTGGTEELDEESLRRLLRRDELWFDRWLDGTAASLTPPWRDSDIDIPPHLMEAYQRGLERRAADNNATDTDAPENEGRYARGVGGGAGSEGDEEDEYGENEDVDWNEMML